MEPIKVIVKKKINHTNQPIASFTCIGRDENGEFVSVLKDREYPDE